MPDWWEEGFEPAFLDDWHYGTKLPPHRFTQADIEACLPRSPARWSRTVHHRHHRRRGEGLQRHIDTGVPRILPVNWVSSVLDPTEVEAAVTAADIELVRQLKEMNVP